LTRCFSYAEVRLFSSHRRRLRSRLRPSRTRATVLRSCRCRRCSFCNSAGFSGHFSGLFPFQSTSAATVSAAPRRMRRRAPLTAATAATACALSLRTPRHVSLTAASPLFVETRFVSATKLVGVHWTASVATRSATRPKVRRRRLVRWTAAYRPSVTTRSAISSAGRPTGKQDKPASKIVTAAMEPASPAIRSRSRVAHRTATVATGSVRDRCRKPTCRVQRTAASWTCAATESALSLVWKRC